MIQIFGRIAKNSTFLIRNIHVLRILVCNIRLNPQIAKTIVEVVFAIWGLFVATEAFMEFFGYIEWHRWGKHCYSFGTGGSVRR